MARLSLLPNDITALLANHPELEIELSEKATDQIADGLNRRITRALVEKRCDQELDNIITDRINWRGERKLTAEYQQLITTETRAQVRAAFGEELNKEVRDLIREEVRNNMPSIMTQVRKEVQGDIRGLLRNELATLLLSK